MIRSLILLILAALVPGALFACSDPGAPDDDLLHVVATTTQLADFARNVGAERVAVEQLLQPNVDPHDFEFSPSDAEKVAGAEVILREGTEIDEWMDELLENAGGDASIVATSQDFSGSTEDPHVWFDPRNAIAMVETVARVLEESDPTGESVYSASASAYIAEIEAMDGRVRTIFSSCAAADLKLVTSHDALGRLASVYGLTIIGTVIPGTDTTSEPSAGELGDLINLIDQQGVPAIFSESAVDTELEEQIAEETGARVVDELFADTLGPAGSGAETYLTMMEYNASAIVDGLGCAA